MNPSPVRLGFVLALLVVYMPMFLLAGPVPANKPAAYPAWWFVRDVIPRLNPNNTAPDFSVEGTYAKADDYAAVNQGQVKNIAKQAYEEMKAKLPGGAGATLDNLWAMPTVSTDDFSAVNLGQLKNVGKPFYDRLISVGYAVQYPWANSATPADDYALTNIGQVKYLFSFVIPFFPPSSNDADGNGIPDVWEIEHFGHTGVDPYADPDQDGLGNLLEFLIGLNPLVGNSGPGGTLRIVYPSGVQRTVNTATMTLN